MDTPDVTYIAVPAPVVMALHQLLQQLPYAQVANLVPAVEQVMNDDHKVDFSPPTGLPEGAQLTEV